MDFEIPFVEEFNKYFQIIVADTDELRSRAYKLRYQVYCLEVPNGLDPKDFPDGEETDEYDCYARQALLVHRPTGLVAGTVRLVLDNDQDPLWMFPVEAQVPELAGSAEFAPVRSKLAEISRFILSSRFRARRYERLYPDGLAVDSSSNPYTDMDHRHIPHPILGIFKAGLDLSWDAGVRFWYSAMEPRLHRRLQMFGLDLGGALASIEYHGNRCVYLSYLPDVLAKCRRERLQIWRFLTDDGLKWSQSTSALDENSKVATPKNGSYEWDLTSDGKSTSRTE
jgi:N-acyl amino acid synthase of PEP-CTERM/exosortase system